MTIIAFVTHPVPVRSILNYLDFPTRPPPLSPARAPPQGMFTFDQTGGFDPTDPEPIPDSGSAPCGSPCPFTHSIVSSLHRRTANPHLGLGSALQGGCLGSL